MTLSKVTRQLTSYIRDPDSTDGPAGIEPRRLNIYRDLFYKNIEGFISGGFPVLRSLFEDDSWHSLVRDFMIQHHCHTPYFLEISQEFLLYLQDGYSQRAGDPLFIQELAHYEWVELALDVADEDLAAVPFLADGDLLEGTPLVSSLAWSLAYQYPVHHIGEKFQPQQAPVAPTFLIVYRNRADEVGFMETNSVTARMLEILLQEPSLNGRQVLMQIATELNHTDPDQVVAGGLEILQKLLSLDIILGTTT
ncbi:MAG: putative DNA-binding domain-containing protein [Oceanicoccus sp.]